MRLVLLLSETLICLIAYAIINKIYFLDTKDKKCLTSENVLALMTYLIIWFIYFACNCGLFILNRDMSLAVS